MFAQDVDGNGGLDLADCIFEVLFAFEHGDIHFPYIVGALRHVSPLPKLLALPQLARFTRDDDSRAVRWNIYRSSLRAIRDLDRDGYPDLGYGSCAQDPNPSDTHFENATMPPSGDGFMYAGRESLVASGVIQSSGLGLTSSGLVPPPPPACP